MSQFHLRSVMNVSATRADVYLCTATGTERPLGKVFRGDGFWHVQGVSGARLMPMMPHTVIRDGKEHGMPLGVVLKLLREKIQGALAPKPVAVEG